MARKTIKPDREKRTKWSVLNPTPSERKEIEALVEAAGMGASAYIIQTVLSKSNKRHGQLALVIHQQSTLITLLSEIADYIAQHGSSPMDTAKVLIALARIEHEISVMHDVKA
ncbi:MAG: hypothetical protein IIX61_02970 [Loktanella sp.]|nr:hypothetical protein [Loktanella sp.]